MSTDNGSDLQALYQEVILDHNRRPRNFRAIANGQQAEGYNPLCGDRVTVYLRIEDGRIQDASFLGSGCAISKAAASLMTDAVKGKTVDEVEQLFERFHRMMTGPANAAAGDAEATENGLGKLSVFAGVRQFPIRVKCATLPWHTLRSAAAAKDEVVSTE